jgi:hypothetical protein
MNTIWVGFFLKFRRFIRLPVSVMFLLFISTPIIVVAAPISVPSQARAVGYDDLTFTSHFSRASVGIAVKPQTGFKWYTWNFFGQLAQPSELKFNADHTLTLLGGHTGPNGQIATAARINGPNDFVGRAFGGGAYIEASLKFSPADVKAAHYIGHPSFWSMAIENLANYDGFKKKSEHGSSDFMEADFFEYDMSRYLHVNNVYGGTLHNWFGVWKKTCRHGWCDISTSSPVMYVPRDTNWNLFHSYGFLWVPATAKRTGYAQFYFDNKPVGKRINWSMCSKAGSSIVTSQSAYCVLDRQHLVLILGTGIGEPMTVRSVHVFQHSAKSNLLH